MQEFDPNAVIIIMGDMNQPPDFFLEEFQESAKQNNILQPYKKVCIPYPTHVNTHRQASWIDNLFIYPRDYKFRVSKKDTFFPEVLEAIHQLQSLSPNCQSWLGLKNRWYDNYGIQLQGWIRHIISLNEKRRDRPRALPESPLTNT